MSIQCFCSLAGIKVLARIVQVDARYAVQHQALVMQCLEHVDPTIQAKVSLSTTELSFNCICFTIVIYSILAAFCQPKCAVGHNWLEE